MKSIVWKKISHPAFLLGLILVLAFVLRVMHLEKESIWWDEYATHVHRSAPTLKAFLANSRTLDPMALPLYYSLEYGVARYFSANLLVLRAVSVFLGLLTIAMLYLLGKYLFDVRAGLVAAMLTALSPVHIYHSQGIRAYALFALLALLALWSFLRLMEEKGSLRWALHLICVAALYWTHPFAPLVTVAMGLFILIQGRAKILFFLRFSLAHILLWLPVGAWLVNRSFWAREHTDSWLPLPSVMTVLSDVFFDDISGFLWQFRLGRAAEFLGTFRWIPDLMLAVLILLLLSRWFRPGRRPVEASSPRFLLFFWLLLPPLGLLLLSLIIRPCMFPRYTLHCSFALYLLLGGALSLIENRRKALLATLLLLCLSACQTLWLYPGPQRTDWFSVARLLQQKSEPGICCSFGIPFNGRYCFTIMLNAVMCLFQELSHQRKVPGYWRLKVLWHWVYREERVGKKETLSGQCSPWTFSYQDHLLIMNLHWMPGASNLNAGFFPLPANCMFMNSMAGKGLKCLKHFLPS